MLHLRTLFVATALSGLLAQVGCSSDAGGGSGGGSASGSDCETVCERTAGIDCADKMCELTGEGSCAADDCVETCKGPQERCADEVAAAIACMTDSDVACGATLGSFGCDVEIAALDQCKAGGDGGGGPGGGGPGSTTSTSTGSGSTGTGTTGSSCEVVCARAAAAGCEAADCVATCETPQAQCDAEYDAIIECGATTGTVTCDGGEAVIEGCDAQFTALLECSSGGTSCYAGAGACDPTDPTSCGAGEACDVAEGEGLVCFPPPNDVPVGGACDPGAGPFCAHGGSCVEGTCAKYCCSDDECDGGTCVDLGSLGGVDVKVCQ